MKDDRKQIDSIPWRDRALLRVPDVIAVTGLSRTTVYALISSGQIPALKINRVTGIRPRDLEHWLDAQQGETNEPGDSRRIPEHPNGIGSTSDPEAVCPARKDGSESKALAVRPAPRG